MKIAGKNVPLWAIITAAVAILAIVVAVAVGTDRSEEATRTVVPSESVSPTESSVTTTSTSVEPNPAKQETSSTATSPPGGGAANGDGSTDGSTQVKSGTVVLKFWNDTRSNKAGDVVIAIGEETWSPRTGQRSDTRKVGPVELERTIDLIVYPDGMDHEKIVIPVVVTARMSGRDVDAIHVELRDTQVRVLGNPVVNFSVTTPRS